MSKIIAYTDGGARGNGKENNVGGYGVVLQYVTENKTHIKELYGGERNTTNNIQELKGAITALEAIKTTHIPIELYCDSAYVVNGINQWVKGWKKTIGERSLITKLLRISNCGSDLMNWLINKVIASLLK